MSKFLWLVFMLVCPLLSWAGDGYLRYIGEMHPPITITEDGKKIEVFFMRNNRKADIDDHVAEGEIYYFQFAPLESKLHYVWKVEGREIISVFLYGSQQRDYKQRSMYVLTKTPVADSLHKGAYYSTMEFPVISEPEKLSVNFFLKGDPQDENLLNCFEGVEVKTGSILRCDYKYAASIKKYLRDRGW